MANEEHSITTYISDMLAVEQHLRTAFGIQKSDRDVMEYEDAAGIVGRLDALSERHSDGLKCALEDLGGHEAAGLKSAVAEVGGALAGAIDKARKTKVSKALRDGYAALALAIASYEELLTTANALGNAGVASLAQRHLTDYANAMLEIGEAIPGIVVRELSRLGLDVDPGVVSASGEAVRQCWQQTSRAPQESTSSRGLIEYEREFAQGELL